MSVGSGMNNVMHVTDEWFPTELLIEILFSRNAGRQSSRFPSGRPNELGQTVMVKFREKG